MRSTVPTEVPPYLCTRTGMQRRYHTPVGESTRTRSAKAARLDTRRVPPIISRHAEVAQPGRAPPCQGGCRGFKSRLPLHCGGRSEEDRPVWFPGSFPRKDCATLRPFPGVAPRDEEARSMSATRAYAAEFLGTFILCFIGAGSICAHSLSDGGVGLVGVALAHGLALAVGITALGHISGGHFNPAVTFGFLLTGRLPANRALGYVIAQLAGAFVGGLLVVAAFSPEVRASVWSGVPVTYHGSSAFKAMRVEFVFSLF